MHKDSKELNLLETKCYMLDTSAILDDPLNISRLADCGENQVFINNVVYSEMNRKKKSQNPSDASYNAREFFRMANSNPLEIIEKEEDVPSCIADTYKRLKIENGDRLIKYTITTKDNENVHLYMISRKKFKTNGKMLEEVEESDMKIAEIALDYNMTLVTNDAGLHMYMQMNEGDSEFLINDSVESPDLITYEKDIYFYKKDVDGLNTQQTELFLSNIEEVKNSKNFTQLTFIEKDISETMEEYETGRVLWAIKNFNLVNLIPMEKSSADSIISFQNKEQAMYHAILTADNAKVVAVSGSTGSGKTLIALNAGIELVKKGVVEGIIYTRNTVTANDPAAELGFRKGGEDQKLGYFMFPLYSSVNFLIEALKKTSGRALHNTVKYAGETNSMEKENATEIFMKEHNISVMDIAHLRGTTINNKFIIIDEAQNMSAASLKLTGTRVGDNSRLVIMGDIGQIDHPYLSKKRNGLTKMLSIAMKDNFVAGVRLLKTVRSDVAEWFDKAL